MNTELKASILKFYGKMLQLFGGSLIDQALHHGLTKHSSSKIQQTLLREEYTAEVKISWIRLVILILFMGLQLVRTIHTGMPFSEALLPALIAVLIALGTIGDYYFLGQKRFEKFFSRFTKYLVITMDTIGMQFLLYHILGQESRNLMIPAAHLFPVSMVFAGTVMVLINIYRINPATCIYNWVVLGISFAFFQSRLQGDYSLPLLETGMPENLQLIQFYATITVTTVLALIITKRMRKIMIRSKRQDQLERFLPEMVAKEVLSGDKDISAGGTRHTVTVMFADIRNFTAFSEQNPPEEVIDLLNAYFNDMISVIFKYRGTLDKILGDGLMAIFGAPFPTPDDAANAVRTAIDMQRKLENFNQLRTLAGQPPIEIGIGIHTGEAILGNVGSDQRFDFTVIGDAVNTASRLEGLTKEYNAGIIFSAATVNALPAGFQTVPLGTARVKGKEKEIEIFTVAAPDQQLLQL